MKLHIKLCIIFSTVTVVLILAFILFTISFERASLYASSEEKLLAVGSRMVSRFENSVEMMDYRLKSLIINNELMDALAMQTYMEPSSNENRVALLEGQNLIANVLQRDPLNSNYHRINAFNKGGLFYSSNENSTTATDSQAKHIIPSLSWLDEADEQPFKPLLLAPYNDPWTIGEDISVFGLARALVWTGQPCGYLEIQSSTDHLEQIFSPEDQNGVEVCAFTSTGELIYESSSECTQRALDYFSGNEEQSLLQLYECDFSSEETGLLLYLSQNLDIWNARLVNSFTRFGLFSLIALACTIFVIWIVSRQFTQSIRTLEHTMKHTHFEGTSILPDGKGLTRNNEIYRIQQAFDALIDRMNVSIHNEMQMRDMHLQAQLNVLQAQINPHFIYNTLNMIAAKALEHRALDIAEACDRFSNMLRYSTSMQDREVALRQEVEHVTNYLELMKSRHEDRLSYEIHIPETLMDARLPRLTLQPLVENSFIHGFQTNLQQMHVAIEAQQTDQGFKLWIHDNGNGFPDGILASMDIFFRNLDMNADLQSEDVTRSGSIGLANTFTRLYLFLNGRVRFALYNEDGAVVELTFL